MRLGDATLLWLMRGDPAIRWQVMRDLLRKPRREWEREQSRVGKEGWGVRLLRKQDATGRWTPRLYGQRWISTTYTMLLLAQMGLPRGEKRVRQAIRLFLEEGLWSDGGINLSATQRRSETCVTGLVLALLCWFGTDDPRRERLVDYLLRAQMNDGGWNCRRDQGARHSSFNTTINVLEGLHEYRQSHGPRAGVVRAAEARAREFFLVHRLYRSHRTGAIVKPEFTRFSFPPRWHHDVLRTLDYFRFSGASYDERLSDPIALVVTKRRRDGRWALENRHAGKTFFEMERVGQSSRWNTLRALRVLDWWDRIRPR